MEYKKLFIFKAAVHGYCTAEDLIPENPEKARRMLDQWTDEKLCKKDGEKYRIIYGTKWKSLET